MWDSYLAIHIAMVKRVCGISTTDVNLNKSLKHPNILFGEANNIKGKLIIDSLSGVDSFLNDRKIYSREILLKYTDYFNKVFSYDWIWLDQYVSGSSKYIQQRALLVNK